MVASCTLGPKPIGEALAGATIQFREPRNVTVDRIVKAEMFKQNLYEEAVSPLSKCFVGMGIYSE